MSGKPLKIGFLGGGRMGQAMTKGFIAAGLATGETIIASNDPADKMNIAAIKALGAESVTDNVAVAKKSDIIIISVKPKSVPVAIADIRKAGVASNKLYLSIAMGVTLNKLEEMLPSDARVIRVMPNTAAMVQCAASVFVKGSKVTEEDVATTKRLLESIGTVEEVGESSIDAVTALSGSGPAYVYIFIEALADGGVKMGLPRDLAYRLASQTVLGAGQMVKETKMHPGVLKDDVTSPGGSTASAIHFLETQAFRAAVIGAVEAACLKCKEVAAAGDSSPRNCRRAN